jgi:hypothetical protein
MARRAPKGRRLDERGRLTDSRRNEGIRFLERDYLTVLKEIETYGNNSRRELCKNCVRSA